MTGRKYGWKCAHCEYRTDVWTHAQRHSNEGCHRVELVWDESDEPRRAG